MKLFSNFTRHHLITHTKDQIQVSFHDYWCSVHWKVVKVLILHDNDFGMEGKFM